MTVYVGADFPVGHPEINIATNRWEKLATATLRAEEAPSGELNLIFVDEVKMANLNSMHLGKSGPTDVLAFPIDAEDPTECESPQLLGDVVICPEVARQNAAAQKKEFEEEIALLVLHGVLHILGYDHATSDESLIMKDREKQLLADLFVA